MNIPKSISLHEAREIVRNFNYKIKTETLSILDAVGRVLAKDVYSDIDVTPFDDSAMDGFAVIAAGLQNATPDAPVTLKCVAHVGAGSVYAETLQPGQAVRIMTGAPVPAGVDAVVKIEDVTFMGSGTTGDEILFTTPIAAGKNIRPAGQEAHAGDCIMAAGTQITPAAAGKLSSCGNLEAEVFARPCVGIISIGSELVEATDVPEFGKIRNSNVWAMQAYVADAGGTSRVYPAVADDYDAIKSVYAQAAAECDIVVSTGGACLGDFDLTPGVLRDLGEILFERVNVKPGKSQPFGHIDGTPVFVLSGNPGASSVGFEVYVRLAMRIMQGCAHTSRPVVRARVIQDINKRDPRMFLQRGRVSLDVCTEGTAGVEGAVSAEGAQGTQSTQRTQRTQRTQNAAPAATQFKVEMAKNQSSALFGALSEANCLAIIPAGTEGVRAGDYVECILLVDEEISFLG